MLSKGLVDISILKGEDIEVGEEEAGRDYKATTATCREPRRTLGCTKKGSTASEELRKRWRPRTRARVRGVKALSPPLGPALDGDTAAEDAGSTTGPALPKSGVDLRAEAAAK